MAARNFQDSFTLINSNGICFDVSMTIERFGILCKRSRYFQCLSHYSQLNKSNDLTRTYDTSNNGVLNFTLYVPLFTNRTGWHLQDTLRQSSGIPCVGDRQFQDVAQLVLFGKKPNSPPFVMAFNMLHLQLCLDILCQSDSINDQVPGSDLLQESLVSVCHLADILASDYLLDYASLWLTTPVNVYLFLQLVSSRFPKDSVDFRRIFVQASPVISLELDHAWATILANNRFARSLRAECYDNLMSITSFWAEQEVWRRCAECSKRISNFHAIAGFEADVQILPCCYNLVHLECLSSMLLRSLSCSHGCSRPSRCIFVQDPRSVLPTHVNCRLCDTLYYRGLMDFDLEDYLTTIKRLTYRSSHHYNGRRLQDTKEFYIYPEFSQTMLKYFP